MAAHRPELSLALVGDGPPRAELERRAGERVHFTGFLEGAELAAAYASADVFVFPSRTDTFGNVVLEAQASALPVVVALEGGPRELIESGHDGLAVDAASPGPLALALDALAADPHLRRRLGARARAAAERRTWDSFLAHAVRRGRGARGNAATPERGGGGAVAAPSAARSR